MSKPREFFVLGNFNSDVKTERLTAIRYEPTAIVNNLHVIEKSAYDKAVEALRKIMSKWNFDDHIVFDIAEETLKELGEL